MTRVIWAMTLFGSNRFWSKATYVHVSKRPAVDLIKQMDEDEPNRRLGLGW